MVLTYNDEFEVTWQKPEDANEHWSNRADRISSALPALSQDVMSVVWDVCFGPMGSRLTWANGIAFQIAPSGYPPLPEEMKDRSISDVWLKAYEPRLRDTARSFRDRDYN